MRVYAISDLHTDYPENLEWARALSESSEHLEDVLVVAGDVSDDLSILVATLRILKATFREVFFTPGNHDLWVRKGERGRIDSLGKLELVFEACQECGVRTHPARIEVARGGGGSAPGEAGGETGGEAMPAAPHDEAWRGSRPSTGPDASPPPSSPNRASRHPPLGRGGAAGERPVAAPPPAVWIFPILSWYHASWDREPDVLGALPIEKVMMDFHVCSWTSEPHLSTADESIARWLDALNEPGFGEALRDLDVERRTCAALELPPPRVISFSHFLPHQALLPRKPFLRFPNLAKACGSDPLAARLALLGPSSHVFGHTHFAWDALLPDGCRYVQCPLGYPAERRRAQRGSWRPWLLEDLSLGGERHEVARKSPYWNTVMGGEEEADRFRALRKA